MPKSDGDLKFEIINEIGVISEHKGNWKLEFNRVSWGGREPKYDIRAWDSNHEKMTKGITLTEEEIRSLNKILEKEIEFIDSPE